VKNWLSNPLKKIIIRELRKILYDHPRYRVDSNNVQNKFSFAERPQRGIIVNNATADRVKLSADNYVGRLSSFCMITYVKNKPGTSIEWVRENYPLLEQFSPRRDVFPTPPGVYRLKIVTSPDEPNNIPGTFTIDPILTVKNELLITFTSTIPGEGQLSHTNLYPKALRLWLDGRRPLLEDVDYSVDYATGLIQFLKPTPVGSNIYADYRYQMPEQGPFQFKSEEFNVSALPGVVIAFGDRIQDCDEMDIVITDDRTDVADIYGGKFETNFSLIVFTRDTEDREKMSDYVIIKILERQNALGFEGLELLDISPGGEEEEVYNAETDDYFYQSSISMSFRVDWELQKSLPIVMYRVEQTSEQEEQEHGYLDGTVKTDLLKVGKDINIAGTATVLGKDLQFECTK
jgi:hypothetical protein